MTKKSCLKGVFCPIFIEKQRFETPKVTIQNHKSGRFQQRNRPLLYNIGIKGLHHPAHSGTGRHRRSCWLRNISDSALCRKEHTGNRSCILKSHT